MTEKIEWYKEVLELEPNSKVFFPLAKLLAREKAYQEAVDVLQKGLARHEEFLEARLLLIELLYAMGEEEQCDRQVRKLDSMFANYAGFWQAWAACLAGKKGEDDTASILRFLAASFLHGPISLHDVINRGLASYSQEYGLNDAGAFVGQTSPRPATHQEGLEEAHLSTDAAAETAEHIPPAEHPEAQPSEEQFSQDAHLAETPAEAANLAEAPQTAEPAPDEAAAEAVAAEKPAERIEEEQIPEEKQPGEELTAEAAETESLAEAEAIDADEPQAEALVGETAGPENELSVDAGETGVAEKEEIPEESLPGEELTADASETEPLAEAKAIDTDEPQAEALVGETAGPTDDLTVEAVESVVSEKEEIPDEQSPRELPHEELTAEAPETEPLAEKEVIDADEPQGEALVGEAAATGSAPDESSQSILEAESKTPNPDEEAVLPGAELPDQSREQPAAHEAAVESGDLGSLGVEGANAAPELEAQTASPHIMDEIRAMDENGGADLPAEQLSEDLLKNDGESLQTIFEENIDDKQPDARSREIAASVSAVEHIAEPEDSGNGQEEFSPKFEDSSEQYTLKTRSMAEVLAEQGDLQGALNIYRELLTNAGDSNEQKDLQDKIDDLSEKLSQIEEIPLARDYELSNDSSKSKEKLISMLEALAQRVEARVQG